MHILGLAKDIKEVEDAGWLWFVVVIAKMALVLNANRRSNAMFLSLTQLINDKVCAVTKISHGRYTAVATVAIKAFKNKTLYKVTFIIHPCEYFSVVAELYTFIFCHWNIAFADELAIFHG